MSSVSHSATAVLTIRIKKFKHPVITVRDIYYSIAFEELLLQLGKVVETVGTLEKTKQISKRQVPFSEYKTGNIKSGVAVYSHDYLHLIQKQDGTVFADANVAPTEPHDIMTPATLPTPAQTRHGMPT